MKRFKITFNFPFEDNTFYSYGETEESVKKIAENEFRIKFLSSSIDKTVPVNSISITDITEWANEKQKLVNIFFTQEWEIDIPIEVERDILNEEISPKEFRKMYISPKVENR